MQPVQLSLIPDPDPTPPAATLPELPGPVVAAAVALLARVITKTVAPGGLGVRGDE